MEETTVQINKIKRIVLGISIGLFLISLTQKCYCTTNQCADSFMVLIVGWLGLFSFGATFTWLANPLILISWILTRRNPLYAFFVSMLATLFCLAFLMFGEVIDNEGGQYKPIIEYRIGYWLWTASAFVMLIGNAFVVRKSGGIPWLSKYRARGFSPQSPIVYNKDEKRRLSYSNDGRSGYVIYKDKQSELRFYFEFGGGDCVAIINIPGVEEWEQNTGRRLAERQGIVNFIAERACRDQAPQGTYKISERFIELFSK